MRPLTGMRAEREREATDERARGNEAAQRVRAQADRTVVELVSDANRQAEIIRGEADARRNNIFATAFSQDAGSSLLYPLVDGL
jgi:Membrane protease subunits, stomatin/prohibitin homologs